jgi:hypothetical protein
MFDTLTEDEFDLLQAKLCSGALASRKVSNDIFDLVDDMESDYGYMERFADTDLSIPVGSKRRNTSIAYSNGMFDATERATSHLVLYRELRDLMPW